MTKTFKSADFIVEALAGVDLTVQDGEFVSLVGPSGCGKSTLFNIIAGLESPSGGQAEIDDESVIGRPGIAAYMPQKDLLLPWLSVLDNAALGLELRGVHRSDARDQANAHFVHFGLDTFQKSWPNQLSGGMRQRVALLRTYLLDRKVMLLDEPFGALDALTRFSMQRWLLDIWGADRRSILFVTHDVDEALFLSDRVYVMGPRPGRIIAELTVPFPRPRDVHVTATLDFGRAKATILQSLYGAGGLVL